MLQLPYGNGELTLQLPDDCQWDVVDYDQSYSNDATASIQEAITSPMGTSPIHRSAMGRKNAVILISDRSRLCPSYLFLPLLLNELNNAGIPDSSIKIIVALGMHRKQTISELETLVGTEVYQRVPVENHSSLPEDCVYMGTTTLGTPIEINRFVAEADFLIATGNIEPHALVGMSGGVKALIPGVASQKCIERNHSLSQIHKVSPGDILNPIHQDLEEALRFVKIDFLLNLIVTHQQKVISAVAGEVIQSHRKGVELAKSRFLIKAEAKYDLVIASTGGFPKDMQLYQAVKALVNASKLLRSKGIIVLAARCEEIFGNGIFQYWVETIQDRKRITDKLKEEFVLGAHKVEHIDQILQQHQVYLYSDIPDSTTGLLEFTPVENLQEMVNDLIQDRKSKIAILPFGSITFPIS